MNFEKIKDYFGYTKSERNGIIVLVIIILILIIILKLMPYLVNKPELNQAELAKFEKEIAEFEQNLASAEDDYESRLDRYITERYDTIQLFKFNPNTATALDFNKLGLTEKQIKTITNYVSKGGKFIDKDDFRKMYGIRQRQFEILSPYLELSENKNNSNIQQTNLKTEIKMKAERFDFDPNNTSEEDWHRMGFSEKQTDVIKNYLAKGGKFRKKEDFQKMFIISAELYSQLEPYIKIPEVQKDVSQSQKLKADTNVKIELNSADTTDLLKISGVGSFFARSIVKYGQSLGGYVVKEQLLEVYGMKKEIYEKVEHFIVVDISKVKKININFVNLKDLMKHPYMNRALAKAIIDYRTNHGAYTNIKQLETAKILSKAEFLKISPYLKVE